MTMIKKIILMGIIVIILALAVVAQTTGNQTSSPSKKTDQQKLKEFNKNTKNYNAFDNQVRMADIQLKNSQLSQSDRIYLENQKKISESLRNTEYEKLKNSRNQVMFTAKDPATSKKMLDNAKSNFAIAESKFQSNPTDTINKMEYERAVAELALATEFNKQVNTNIQPCPNAWSCIGGIMTAYNQYKGIGEFALLAWPQYGEWSNKWKKTITDSFCLFNGIKSCMESTICGAVLDTSSGNTIAGNILFGRGSDGKPLPAGTISAERSLPLIIKGMENDLLIDVIGSELIILNNQFVNISEVDTTTLPAQEIRLYRIQYTLTNIHGERDLSYNIEIKGKTSRKVFSNDKKLKPGQTEKQTIEAYKTTEYDEVCLTFDPSLPSGGSVVGQLTVQPKMVNKLCKSIAEYAGGATSAGNYAIEEQKSQPSGGMPGGTW